MSNNGTTVVPPNSTGNAIDCSSLSSGGVTVYRQRVVLADNTHSANFATVSAGSLQVIVENASLVVSGQVSVTGSVAVSTLGAGTNHIGEVNISLMPQVSVLNVAGTAHIGEVNVSLMPAVVIAAGTNNIGFINGISATVNVAGSLAIGSLAAGTNHIGEVNISLMPAIVVTSITNQVQISNISATVNVAGTFTVGGQTGNGSASVGSTYTLIGGMDGSIGRVALTDANGHFVITGTVALAAGASNIGTINNISAGVVLAAGAANIGTINNISAAVVLAAGTANIGTLNNISAAVALAAGTAHIGEVNISLMPQVSVLNVAGTAHMGEVNISLMPAVVLAAGTNNIGSINNISAAVVLAAGTNNIGTIQAISAAVSLVANTAYHPTGAPSASHGPKTVSMTASATVALIAAPGASLSIYVTGMLATNGSSTLTQLQIYEASATATPVIAPFLAASGGGFSTQFDPPWRISANTALNARLKPSVGATVCVTLNFYVGA